MSLTLSKTPPKPTVYLEPGSIWFDLELNKILAFSPFRTNPCIYKIKGTIAAKKIEKNFSDKDAFYFWASRAINYEFNSAQNLSPRIKSDLHFYHRDINYLSNHFEYAERTVSHVFCKPHPALGDLSYGERLFQSLSEERFIPHCGLILEIGAGAGIHSRDFLKQMQRKIPNIYNRMTHIFLDLAPGLLKAQRKEGNLFSQKRFFIQADALCIPFAPESLDLVIANEVVADFPVLKVNKAKSNTYQIIKKYNLEIDDAPPIFLINIGAIKFLEELKRILKPKAKAVIIEYGEDWTYPTATELKDHIEYSIHFGHLISVAKKLGFKIKYTNLFDFLRFKLGVRVITGNSLLLLQRLMKHLNRSLPTFAYTQEMLKEELGSLYKRIHNLCFEDTKYLASIFRLQDFKVLLLKK